jgi:short-subunit dehydrogenase
VNVSGSRVLVTGATGGLGQAIARRLHAAGAQLVLTGRRVEVLEPLAAEVGAQALAVDLADPAAVERLAAECADVDVLVANAGLPGSGHLLTFSAAEIDRALAVNLRSAMILSRVIGERMVARGSGHIVLMSSLSGKIGSPGSSVYSATKFGLRGFAQGLREDLGPRGIGVSGIFPGFVRDAGMFADSGATLPFFVGTATAAQVADAVLRAIERNRAEIAVAPLSMRLGSAVGGLVPGLATAIQRRLGGEWVSEQLSAGQRVKR